MGVVWGPKGSHVLWGWESPLEFGRLFFQISNWVMFRWTPGENFQGCIPWWWQGHCLCAPSVWQHRHLVCHHPAVSKRYQIATRATHIGESGSVKLSLKEKFKFRYTHMNICIYSIPHISRYFIRCSRSVGCNLENQLLGGKISKLDQFPVYWFPVFIMGTCVVFCPTHSLRKLAVSSLISTYASRF